MKVKSKKENFDGIVRLETSGELKDVVINEDFLHPKDASIALCFKGKSSSGIVELTPEEIEIIYNKVAPKVHLLKNIKVMKFEND